MKIFTIFACILLVVICYGNFGEPRAGIAVIAGFDRDTSSSYSSSLSSSSSSSSSSSEWDERDKIWKEPDKLSENKHRSAQNGYRQIVTNVDSKQN